MTFGLSCSVGAVTHAGCGELRRCSHEACCALARRVAYVPINVNLISAWQWWWLSCMCATCQEWLGITWMETSFISRVTCFRGSWGVIPALSAPVSWCKLIPVGNTRPKWLAESSWLASCLASGLHFRTSGTALPVSATVCGKMRIWERNRIPLLCTSLKCCCKCRTFASAALNIWVNL